MYIRQNKKCFIRQKKQKPELENYIKKPLSFNAGVCIYVKLEKAAYCYSVLFLSERFWMKKTFFLGEGVFLYVKPKNALSAKRNKNLNLKIR